MSASAADPDKDRLFRPTSGTAAGWTGVVLALVGLVGALAGDHTLGSARFALAAAVFGLLVYCFLLRPRIVIRRGVLELRNPFGSWHVPLADVRKVVVRAVTRVYTDEHHFDGVAVGRTVRSMVRGKQGRQLSVGVPGLGASRIAEDPAARRMPRGQLDTDMVADFVGEQILLAADRAREVGEPTGTPSRSWAWPELTALAVLGVALLVSLLV